MRATPHTARAMAAPPPADDVLLLWVAWHRQRVPIRELARRTGYSRQTIHGLLTGERETRQRERVIADVREALGL